MSAAYAYLDAEITRSTSSLEGVPLQGKRPGLTPRHSANLWLVRKLGGGFSVGGGANYVSERFSSPSQLVTLPGYVTADVAAFYKSKRFDVTLDIKTLFYKRHYVSAHGSSSNLNLPGPPNSDGIGKTQAAGSAR